MRALTARPCGALERPGQLARPAVASSAVSVDLVGGARRDAPASAGCRTAAGRAPGRRGRVCRHAPGGLPGPRLPAPAGGRLEATQAAGRPRTRFRDSAGAPRPQRVICAGGGRVRRDGQPPKLSSAQLEATPQGRLPVDLAARGSCRPAGPGAGGAAARRGGTATNRPARPPALWRPGAPRARRRGDAAGQAARRRRVRARAKQGDIHVCGAVDYRPCVHWRVSLCSAEPLRPWAPPSAAPHAARPCRARRARADRGAALGGLCRVDGGRGPGMYGGAGDLLHCRVAGAQAARRRVARPRAPPATVLSARAPPRARMAEPAAGTHALWSEFLLWVFRGAGYSLATIVGSWVILTWLQKRLGRRARTAGRM